MIMTNRLSKFDSLREMIDYAADNKNTGDSNTDDMSFTGGTRDLAHAVDVARVGWDAVRPDVDKMTVALSGTRVALSTWAGSLRVAPTT
jgi:hypothetical protein